MKSLNMKNIAAIVTGVAMVGSLATVGLAAPNVGADVNEFVQMVKENPESVSVVVGNLADVHDAISAAELVSAIRESTATEETKTNCTLVEYPVITELTGSNYPLQGVGSLPDPEVGSSGYETSDMGSKTLTYTTMPEVLSEYKESYYLNGETESFYFEDQIILPEGMNVNYNEDDNNYGLFLNAEGDSFPFYRWYVQGNGIPTDGEYRGLITIPFLGKEYTLDTNKLADEKVYLYDGAEHRLNLNEEVEGVRLHSISLDIDEVEVEVNGTIKTLYTGLPTEFEDKVVTLVSLSKVWDGEDESYKAKLIIGNEGFELRENKALPMDENYEVSEINFVDGYLKNIDIRL